MGHEPTSDAAMAHEHTPHLAHHFETSEQQFVAGKLGMWLFLATEILLFGGLFCAYAIYRASHPEIFQYAHRYLDKTLGGINTIVLICSSLTMAWGVHCAQRGQRRGLIACLVLTLLFACTFLGIKYVEYSHKWKDGLLPGTRFDPQYAPGEHGHGGDADETAQYGEHTSDEPAGETGAASPSASDDETPLDVGAGRSRVPPAADGPSGLAEVPWLERPKPHAEIKERPSNVHIFFGIYFSMTGLHGLHVIAGMGVIVWILIRSIKGHFGADYFTPVDLAGLYWHLVDLIWIYLFPLLYLIH
ncbi:MAG TPA: cytochrome c oxidase subunit 3 family protein [Phycisphaerae bacterium]|nr:cytochrome c oxidase subunit 3 family protein [Phycisphaerae bacterium]